MFTYFNIFWVGMVWDVVSILSMCVEYYVLDRKYPRIGEYYGAIHT